MTRALAEPIAAAEVDCAILVGDENTLRPDGQNLLAADGADQTQSALKGDRFEVILGPDRYVIPAKADASAK